MDVEAGKLDYQLPQTGNAEYLKVVTLIDVRDNGKQRCLSLSQGIQLHLICNSKFGHAVQIKLIQVRG